MRYNKILSDCVVRHKINKQSKNTKGGNYNNFNADQNRSGAATCKSITIGISNKFNGFILITTSLSQSSVVLINMKLMTSDSLEVTVISDDAFLALLVSMQLFSTYRNNDGCIIFMVI